MPIEPGNKQLERRRDRPVIAPAATLVLFMIMSRPRHQSAPGAHESSAFALPTAA